ncbi:oligosaccharide flippase family protein [Pseudomonadales bacterium]|nr:oligosaccharide flippase family protein [Rubripirellula sp.]MDB4494451.1 oligosaccharide flippase family protein [Pseudomonadales bacterium]MDC0287884.1 oligosaccharide flippase family protein [Rubripirellula sp.]
MELLDKVARRRIGVNVLSVFGGDALNKAGTFFVYVFVGRMLGVYEFGQLSIGMLLLYTFQVLSAAGLPVALTRWVTRCPGYSTYLLRQSYRASILPSSLSILGMWGVAFLMEYDSATLKIITVLSVAIPLYTLTTITEAVIKGREQMHLIPVGNLCGNLFLVTGTSVLLLQGFGVLAVAYVVVCSKIATLLVIQSLYRNNVAGSVQRVRQSGSFLKLLPRAFVFFGIDGLQAINASVLVLLLSKIGGEVEVGLFAAAVQLLQPMQTFYRSLGHSLFPPLILAARSSAGALTRLTRVTLTLVLRVSIPVSLLMCCFAQEILGVVYGGVEFHRSVVVLQILSFSLLFFPLPPVLGHALWAVNLERSVLRIVVVNFVARVLFGFVLIYGFGLIGAAVSVLACSGLNVLQHYLLYCQKVGKLALWKELWKLVPGILLALACVLLFPFHRYVNVTIGLILYALLTFRSVFRLSSLTQVNREST